MILEQKTGFAFLLPERQGDFNTTPAEHDGAQQAEQTSWCVLESRTCEPLLALVMIWSCACTHNKLDF